jgi:hypothetical protein
MHLIDATPFLHRQVGKNEWMFQYGRGRVGEQCGAAYFNNQNPRYVRFNVVERDGQPVFEPISERSLTAEELKHFSRMVKAMQHLTSRDPGPHGVI